MYANLCNTVENVELKNEYGSFYLSTFKFDQPDEREVWMGYTLVSDIYRKLI